jgi:hypothetical protein
MQTRGPAGRTFFAPEKLWIGVSMLCTVRVASARSLHGRSFATEYFEI